MLPQLQKMLVSGMNAQNCIAEQVTLSYNITQKQLFQ